MASGTVLPIVAAAPADVAASGGRSAPTGADPGGGESGGFGALLEARIEALTGLTPSTPDVGRMLAALQADEAAVPGSIATDPQADATVTDPALAALLAAQTVTAAPVAAPITAAVVTTPRAADDRASGLDRAMATAGAEAGDRDATGTRSAVPDVRTADAFGAGTSAGFGADAGFRAADPESSDVAATSAARDARAPTFALAQAPEPAREAARPAPVRTEVAIPVGSAGWGQALSERVTWLVRGQQSGAELQLNPPHLGPVEIRISMGNDQQASLSFFSPHASVREAVQAALPRLHDAFAASGLSLGQVSVGAESSGQRWQGPAPDGRPGGDGGREVGRLAVDPISAPIRGFGAARAVDLFA
ncbi:MAG: flagellar hook-length control protein FliK [Burkholderiales bacterium]|jgi:flagellar hook-length control protein FliK|nr:flagellar hook-length control protein FliK [Burkholderiales bacterium]